MEIIKVKTGNALLKDFKEFVEEYGSLMHGDEHADLLMRIVYKHRVKED